MTGRHPRPFEDKFLRSGTVSAGYMASPDQLAQVSTSEQQRGSCQVVFTHFRHAIFSVFCMTSTTTAQFREMCGAITIDDLHPG
jgi:hypothetical protein